MSNQHQTDTNVNNLVTRLGQIGVILEDINVTLSKILDEYVHQKVKSNPNAKRRNKRDGKSDTQDC